MTVETKSHFFKLQEEDKNCKLYTYVVDRYTGTHNYYWLEGTKEAVFDRMYKIYREESFSIPKFKKLEEKDDGTVIFKGERLTSLGY